MGKYMGDQEKYDRVTFQAMNSGVVAGSAERLRDYLADFLRQQKEL
jgi:hypothetical protein